MLKRYSLDIATHKLRHSGYFKAILHVCVTGSNSMAIDPDGSDLLMITCFFLRTKGTGLDEVEGNAKS